MHKDPAQCEPLQEKKKKMSLFIKCFKHENNSVTLK